MHYGVYMLVAQTSNIILSNADTQSSKKPQKYKRKNNDDEVHAMDDAGTPNSEYSSDSDAASILLSLKDAPGLESTSDKKAEGSITSSGNGANLSGRVTRSTRRNSQLLT